MRYWRDGLDAGMMFPAESIMGKTDPSCCVSKAVGRR